MFSCRSVVNMMHCHCYPSHSHFHNYHDFDDDIVTTTIETVEYRYVNGNYVKVPTHYEDSSRSYDRTRYFDHATGNTRTYVRNIFTGTSPITGERVSHIEETFLNSKTPVLVDDHREPPRNLLTVNGYTGEWMNEEECRNWRGPIPIEHYRINREQPHIVKKQVCIFTLILNKRSKYTPYRNKIYI